MSDWYYLIYFVLAGLIIGSFLNVCLFRIPKDISVVSGNNGRSFCPHCQRNLLWYDMIPVLSYLLLKGKCRFCRNKISLRYPAIELMNAIVWGFLGWRYGLTINAFVYCLLFSILLALAYVDYQTMEIPDVFQLCILLLAVVSLFNGNGLNITDRILGSIIISVPMLLIAILIQGFGIGDVLLMFVSGLLLGWRAILLAFFLAVFSGGAHAFVILLLGKKEKRIAFGPHLALGIMIAAIWSERMLSWYFRLL